MYRNARTLLLFGLLALVAVTAAPRSSAANDPLAGKELTERWCSGCHVEGRGAATANDQAPTFAHVARTRGCAPEALRSWLANPHPPMPNLSLTRMEIDNVVAYLCELATQ